MPTNHTTNYQLSQWEHTDRVLMDDFNADNTKIDGALGSHEGRVAALEQQVPLLGNCRVKIYQYTGDGRYAQEKTVIPFDEKPLFIIVAGDDGTHCLLTADSSTAVVCRPAGNNLINSQWSADRVAFSNVSTSLLQMNAPNVHYSALMFLPSKS